MLGLAPGEEVTEAQLRYLFGERGRHPYADRIEAERLAADDSPKQAYRVGALGRRVMVTGVDFVLRAGARPVAGVDRGRGCGDPVRQGRRVSGEAARQHEYVTVVDDEGELRFLPVVSGPAPS
ncbi:hypothetical protein ABZ943_18505 [Streptomyces rubiginosohelvolus]|uniref:hypothetical protein n=1 Tax=Streptomyces rubiginosohelvolus TaxID=67362 RepID=UPI0033CADB84